MGAPLTNCAKLVSREVRHRGRQRQLAATSVVAADELAWGWRDVLVHPEEVGRVVLVLEGDELAVLFCSEGGAHSLAGIAAGPLSTHRVVE